MVGGSCSFVVLRDPELLKLRPGCFQASCFHERLSEPVKMHVFSRMSKLGHVNLVSEL